MFNCFDKFKTTTSNSNFFIKIYFAQPNKQTFTLITDRKNIILLSLDKIKFICLFSQFDSHE